MTETKMFVTQPGNTQNFNRYSYVANNPLSYVDPSGFAVGAIAGGLTAGLQEKYGSTPQEGSKAARAEADAKSIVGKIWALPDTIAGLVYGGLGYVTGKIAYWTGYSQSNPGISHGHNAIEFVEDPLMSTAMTFGNVIVYGRGYSPIGVPEGYTFSTGQEEQQHTFQAEALGPAYFAAHLLFGVAALVMNYGSLGFINGWHGPQNILEQGPHPELRPDGGGVPSPWGH